MENYYRISLEEVLGNHNVELSEKLLNDIILVYEMRHEYSGISEQTKNTISEADLLKEEIKNINHKHKMLLSTITKNYAESLKIAPERVIIENGKILVEEYYG